MTAKELLRGLREASDPYAVEAQRDTFNDMIDDIQNLIDTVSGQTQGSAPMTSTEKRSAIDHLRQAQTVLKGARKSLGK